LSVQDDDTSNRYYEELGKNEIVLQGYTDPQGEPSLEEFLAELIPKQFWEEFHAVHGDLFSAGYYYKIQEQLRRGEVPEFFAYPLELRLHPADRAVREEAFSASGVRRTRNLSVLGIVGTIFAAVLVWGWLLALVLPLASMAYGAQWWLKQFARMQASGLSPPPFEIPKHLHRLFPTLTFMHTQLPPLSPAAAFRKLIQVDLTQLASLLAGRSPKEQDFILTSIVTHHERLHGLHLPHLVIYPWQMLHDAAWLLGQLIKTFAQRELKLARGFTWTTVGKEGHKPGEFDAPQALVIDPQGRFLVVVDMKANTGQFYDLDTKRFSRLVVELKEPFGVAIDPAGEFLVFASSGEHQLKRYDLSSGEVTIIPGEFDFPQALAIDRRGWLWVAETGSHRLQAFDLKTMKVVDTIGGELNFPHDLAIDAQDRILIAVRDNHRIARYDPSTKTLTTLLETRTESGESWGPHGLAIDPQNRVLVVADADHHHLWLYDFETLKVLAVVGQKGAEPGQFQFPHSPRFDPQGQLWVADRGNHRLQKAQLPKRKLFTFFSGLLLVAGIAVLLGGGAPVFLLVPLAAGARLKRLWQRFGRTFDDLPAPTVDSVKERFDVGVRSEAIVRDDI